MYIIRKTEYGMYVRMSGILAKNEMAEYTKEKEAIQKTLIEPYSVFVDLRGVVPISSEDKKTLKNSQKRSKDKLLRMTIILDSPVVMSVAKRITASSGIIGVTRCIDASRVKNWEELGLNWAVHGIEPVIENKTETLQKDAVRVF